MGLTRKVDRMPFNDSARDVASYYLFGVSIPSSGLTSIGEGPLPFFAVKKLSGQSVS